MLMLLPICHPALAPLEQVHTPLRLGAMVHRLVSTALDSVEVDKTMNKY